jgi:hypothetical protein
MQAVLNTVGKLFANTVVFVLAYILLMLPTYYLPYVGSNSAVLAGLGAATGMGLSPQFWMHLTCLYLLVVITWLRGCQIQKQWITVFPVIASVFDMVPGVNLVPLIPTAMHICALVFGARGNAQQAESAPVPVLGGSIAAAGAVAVLAGLVHGFTWYERYPKPQVASSSSATTGSQRTTPKPLSSIASPQAAGVATKQSPSATASDVRTSAIGQWHDGGPACASIRKGANDRSLIFRSWYCEADESVAKALILTHDATVSAYVDEESGLSVRTRSDGKLEVSAKSNIRERLGDGVFLDKDLTLLSKK